MLNENFTQQIQEAARDEPLIVAVYVFGSAAKGEFSKTSDIDIAIVVKDRKIVRPSWIYEIYQEVTFPRDPDFVVVDRNSSPLLLFEIAAHGTCLFSRSEAHRSSFEAYAMRNYYDSAHMRKIYHHYLPGKFTIRSNGDK